MTMSGLGLSQHGEQENEAAGQVQVHLSQLRKCLESIRHLQRISNGKSRKTMGTIGQRDAKQEEREQMLRQLEVSF